MWLPLGLLALVTLAVGLYFFPPIHERLSWRMANVQAQVYQFFNPPEQQVFVPRELPTLVATLATFTSAPSAGTPAAATPFPTTTAGPTATPSPIPTETPSPTPLPPKALLSGFRHEYQKFNNCGPATLSMLLNWWGWQGDQLTTRAFLRPAADDIDDKNTGPQEMVAFVEEETELRALARVNGNLDLLKRLIVAGFPVIIERGLQLPDEFWEGHYALVHAYDDARQKFTTQDSLILPDFPVPYAELEQSWWRDFNYLYLVVYPPEREAEVFALLGPDSNEFANYQRAAERAERETQALQGRDLFFAWYNLGSSRLGLQDYAGAAAAYDQAFAIYPTLAEDQRPYRALWYMHGPFEAYFQAGRFQDAINLADTTLATTTSIGLEEVWYWRGLAQKAISQRTLAVRSLQQAVKANPTFELAKAALRELGENAP
jgi:tetratricopeptide (TPR) repeat protein